MDKENAYFKFDIILFPVLEKDSKKTLGRNEKKRRFIPNDFYVEIKKSTSKDLKEGDCINYKLSDLYILENNKNRKYNKDFIKLMNITEECVLIYTEGHFLFDIYNSFKNLSNKSKKIIKDLIVKSPPSLEWINLIKTEYNQELNIYPTKAQYVSGQIDSLLNLNFTSAIETIDDGTAFLSPYEINEYKKHALKTFFNLLESKKIKEKKFKYKKTSLLRDKIENKTLYKRGRKYLDVYTDYKSKSFIYRKNENNCIIKIERKGSHFEATIFYKNGEPKIKYLMSRNEDYYDSNILSFNGAQIYAKDGVAFSSFDLKEKLNKEVYFGLSSVVGGVEYYSDYTKSFDSFFKEIEDFHKRTLTLEEKRSVIKSIYKKKEINNMKITRKIKDKTGLDYKEYSDLDLFLELIELNLSK
jgi:hypothetical protein